jgi:hypothetical protein
VPLPATAREGEPAEVCLAAIDARTATELPALLATLASGVEVLVVAPVGREGGRAWLGWAMSLARRVHPLPLEHVCDALRHAGVVDVRVLDVEGPLGIVVVRGCVAG